MQVTSAKSDKCALQTISWSSFLSRSSAGDCTRLWGRPHLSFQGKVAVRLLLQHLLDDFLCLIIKPLRFKVHSLQSISLSCRNSSDPTCLYDKLQIACGYLKLQDLDCRCHPESPSAVTVERPEPVLSKRLLSSALY